MREPAEDSAPLDYRNPMHVVRRKRPSVGRIIFWTLGGIVLVCLLVALLWPAPPLGRARESGNRVKCASNLRQIGQAIQLYRNENGGQLPPDFIPVLLTQDITAEVFTCPSSEVEHAKGATPQQTATEMLSGDHLSYAYVNGLNAATITGDTILAFDTKAHVPVSDATTTGINVLLGDGTSRFVDEKVAKAILARFNAGVRPILLSDCDPTVSPATAPAGLPK